MRIPARQLGLGSLVGLTVGLFCWRGSQSAQVVSVFPDALTLAVLAFLSIAALRFIMHRDRLHGSTAVLQASLTMSAAAGVVFGAIVISVGLATFVNPTLALLGFGFATAMGSAVACGLIAAVVSSRGLSI